MRPNQSDVVGFQNKSLKYTTLYPNDLLIKMKPVTIFHIARAVNSLLPKKKSYLGKLYITVITEKLISDFVIERLFKNINYTLREFMQGKWYTSSHADTLLIKVRDFNYCLNKINEAFRTIKIQLNITLDDLFSGF